MPPTEVPPVRIELNPDDFRSFVTSVKDFLGDDLELFVLPLDLEPLIFNAYTSGHVSDLVSYSADEKHAIRMKLLGVKVLFTHKLELGNHLFMVRGHKTMVGPNNHAPTDGEPVTGEPEPVATAMTA